MGIFDTVFHTQNPDFVNMLGPNGLEAMATEEGITGLRDQMAQDNISIDGLMFKAGNLAILSGLAAIRDKESVKRDSPLVLPTMVARIENSEALEHDVVLAPMFKKAYEGVDLVGEMAKYYTYIMPFAPDQEKEVGMDDIKRTIQVLKADGKAHHLWDVTKDNFVFLEGLDHKLLSYPSSEDVPADFRGKPIAFIRDLNAVPKMVDEKKALPRLQGWVRKNLNIEYDALEPAPRACVEACKQQYALSAALGEELREVGITPNVDIPAPPPLQTNARGQEAGERTRGISHV